ncbi:MAG: diguanylate cyclase [Flexilinea sp.]|nr:diguanylate cyclase [Flexilinea sp.]
MTKRTYPLSRSITIACLVFFVLLTAVMAYGTYRIYKNTMYARYREEMVSIVNYIESFIDHDDMSQCAETYIPSEKHAEIQALFDNFVDYYNDVHYLYIVRATDPDDPAKLRSVCSANSSYEKEYEPDNLVYIGDGGEDWYPEKTVQTIRDIQAGSEDVFFDDPSEWGNDYSLGRPLVDSAGKHYGVLCVDVSIDELQHMITRYTRVTVVVIMAMGILFIVLLLVWMRGYVIDPLHKLESSVTAFASSSHGQRNPDELVFDPPEISSSREVESLSRAVSKMSMDMKDYVIRILDTEKEVRGLQAHMTEINTIAYQDALTHVNNKAAYDKKVEMLNSKIYGMKAEFAIVMADLNHLKMINDQYGHDKGNEYLVGSCKLICDVFAHSPVYRVGGDEFVVILQKRDYRNRNDLMAIVEREFSLASAKENAEPWERYSAAFGMAVYNPGEDLNAESVFKRADHAMYEAKMKMRSAADSI